MNWTLFWRGLRLIYLLRVPLATLLLLAVLGPLARGSSLLENLLDLSASPWDVFQVSLGAFLLAYAAISTLNLTLYYGDARFGDSIEFPLAQKRPLTAFIAATLAAAIFVVFVVARTESPAWISALMALTGFILALILVFLSKLIQLAFTDPISTPHPPPFLVFPAFLIPSLETIFDNLYCWHSDRSGKLKTWINRACQWPLEILRYAGQGYLIDINAPRGSLRLQSGHVFALSLSIIALLIYALIGLGKRHITAAEATVPALAFVLLFLNAACWGLAALTFFFDRYRFPLLWTLVALALITGTAPESDHFFRVETHNVDRGGPPLSPAAYLKAKIQANQGAHLNLVFVATPGGGIQAAAWTAQVLSGVESTFQPQFHSSIAAISSVSGGSLGSLLYAATFQNWVKPENLAQQARESAIDEVAWGLTQPDFWRAIAPWFGERTLDRGWALEEKWIAINHLGPKRLNEGELLASRFGKPPEDSAAYPGHDILLSDWAKAGAAMPALLFNSMLVERGQHVVFSTTSYPPKGDQRGIVNFYDLYPDLGRSFDIRAATAARLSASFPYVAPAARPNLDTPYADAFHIVDGGYYDNYGIDALVGWLRAALDDPEVQAAVKDIFVLQIRHFDPSAIANGSHPGWIFQLHAPISGLLSMWNAAPVNRDRNEIELFRQIFNQGGRRIWSAVIAYDSSVQSDAVCASAPLSWKLSPREQDCITHVWNAEKQKSGALACLKRYFDRSADGVQPIGCEVLE